MKKPKASDCPRRVHQSLFTARALWKGKEMTEETASDRAVRQVAMAKLADATLAAASIFGGPVTAVALAAVDLLSTGDQPSEELDAFSRDVQRQMQGSVGGIVSDRYKGALQGSLTLWGDYLALFKEHQDQIASGSDHDLDLLFALLANLRDKRDTIFNLSATETLSDLDDTLKTIRAASLPYVLDFMNLYIVTCAALTAYSGTRTYSGLTAAQLRDEIVTATWRRASLCLQIVLEKRDSQIYKKHGGLLEGPTNWFEDSGYYLFNEPSEPVETTTFVSQSYESPDSDSSWDAFQWRLRELDKLRIDYITRIFTSTLRNALICEDLSVMRPRMSVLTSEDLGEGFTKTMLTWFGKLRFGERSSTRVDIDCSIFLAGNEELVRGSCSPLTLTRIPDVKFEWDGKRLLTANGTGNARFAWNKDFVHPTVLFSTPKEGSTPGYTDGDTVPWSVFVGWGHGVIGKGMKYYMPPTKVAFSATGRLESGVIVGAYEIHLTLPDRLIRSRVTVAQPQWQIRPEVKTEGVFVGPGPLSAIQPPSRFYWGAIEGRALRSQLRVVAIDYTGSGRHDHLLVYLPGSGQTPDIFRSVGGNLQPIAVASGRDNQQGGLGGFSLNDSRDRIFAFDYTGKGRRDHLVCYRPGEGTLWVLRRAGTGYESVYRSDPKVGVGGFKLSHNEDRVLAYNQNGPGYPDNLVCYRPGSGALTTLRVRDGSFVPHLSTESGIGDVSLRSAADRVITFDYAGDGTGDALVCYRPGEGLVSIGDGNLNVIPLFGEPGYGIGGYDFKSTADRLMAFDLTGTGHKDHLLCYRPGEGAVTILARRGAVFDWAYHTVKPGQGIGGYPLDYSLDRLTSIDADSSGAMNDLVVHRMKNKIDFPRTPMLAIIGHPVLSQT